jgi:predicted RNase H-like HicB family nuclease
MKPSPHRYLVKIWYSEEDSCYLAEVPALSGCTTHGKTFSEAAKHVDEAIALWIEDAANHGDQIPEPDLAAEEVRRLAPILNIAKLARRAGVNQHTLASKLRRGTRFTPTEAIAIRHALETV